MTSSHVSRFDSNKWTSDGIVNYASDPHNRWTAYESPNSADCLQIQSSQECGLSGVGRNLFIGMVVDAVVMVGLDEALDGLGDPEEEFAEVG